MNVSPRKKIAMGKMSKGYAKGGAVKTKMAKGGAVKKICLLYTSPSPRDQRGSRMPSSA